jgi:hypothetical protein
MIVARQFIAWNPFNRDPSRRARSDPYPWLIRRPDLSTPMGPNHTVPYGTAPVFARIPGNKLPGYDHTVPTGQNPVHLSLAETLLCRALSRKAPAFHSRLFAFLFVFIRG